MNIGPESDTGPVISNLRDVLSGETTVVHEYQPVEDAGGEQIGISVTVIDVTEHRATEAVLSETEEHARRSIELSANILWSSDAKGVVNFVGPTIDGAAETTVDRIANWYRRMHPDDRLRVRQEWLAWLPSGRPFHTMFRMRLQDDNWSWMQSRAKPHRDVNGDIIKWYGVIVALDAWQGNEPTIEQFETSVAMGTANSLTGVSLAPWRPIAVANEGGPRDAEPIDARKIANQHDVLPTELLVSMLMRMFESAPIAMSITTSDTRTSSYVKVNEAYLRLTGLKWDDIRGKRLTDDGAAIDNPARDRRHRLLEEEGAYELEEVDIAYADGTIIPTLISAQRTVIDGVSFDVEVILDVSARVRQQREIENALRTSARTDALSGLPNRACFDEVVTEAVALNLLNDRKLALAYVDLNDFKIVNDMIGHSAGDEVLRTIANRLRESFRATDFIARIGGDEFVVLLDIDRKLAGNLQADLQETMERVFKPIPIDGQVTFTGAAVGVTFLRADDTVQSFLKRADEYMYIAKTTGERVAVVCFGQILDRSHLPQRAARQMRRP